MNERIEQLPELPVKSFEVTGKLEYSDRVPIITIRPHKFPAPKKPSTTKKRDNNKSVYYIKKYWMWATYPIVICQPPAFDLPVEHAGSDALFEQRGMDDSNKPESNLEILSKKERFYKLTTFKNRKLRHPWWCSVRYGPWTAIVTEVESCFSPEDTRWMLYLSEKPEVAFRWYGEWTDIPSYPSLTLFPNLPLTHSSVTYEFCL
jgi:hypothetical protein